MRFLALLAITAYQRYVSPHKGFTCAYRLYTGHAGCSQLGYRAIRRYGVIGGISVLRERTYLCGVAHRRMAVAKTPRLRLQRGECDLGGCDLPCDIFSNCGSCDFGSGKEDEKERRVHIPPDVRV